MKVNMIIERLVLDGLSIPYPQQSILQTAVETELSRLFTAKGTVDGLTTGGAISHISASDIQLADERDPTHLGQQIARAVFEGVNR